MGPADSVPAQRTEPPLPPGLWLQGMCVSKVAFRHSQELCFSWLVILSSAREQSGREMEDNNFYREDVKLIFSVETREETIKCRIFAFNNLSELIGIGEDFPNLCRVICR